MGIQCKFERIKKHLGYDDPRLWYIPEGFALKFKGQFVKSIFIPHDEPTKLYVRFTDNSSDFFDVNKSYTWTLYQLTEVKFK